MREYVRGTTLQTPGAVKKEGEKVLQALEQIPLKPVGQTMGRQLCPYSSTLGSSWRTPHWAPAARCQDEGPGLASAFNETEANNRGQRSLFRWRCQGTFWRKGRKHRLRGKGHRVSEVLKIEANEENSRALS